jgi:hypothetical protein
VGWRGSGSVYFLPESLITVSQSHHKLRITKLPTNVRGGPQPPIRTLLSRNLLSRVETLSHSRLLGFLLSIPEGESCWYDLYGTAYAV